MLLIPQRVQLLDVISSFSMHAYRPSDTLGLAPLRASGPLEANSLSGGNWPERGVFLSTDGSVSYL